MSDPYIDYVETLGYGDFAAGQLRSMVAPIDPEMASATEIHAKRIEAATNAMRALLDKGGKLDKSTYAAASESTQNPVTGAHALFRKLVSYVESRDEGDAISKDVRDGRNLTTILRRRPVKLAAALTRAAEAIKRHEAKLDEHASWSQRIAAAKDALDQLNAKVRSARTDKRVMTPEITAARESWLTTYAAAKRFAESVLGPAGQLDLMPDVFDDLAEVHKVGGASDNVGAPVTIPTPPAG